jgi:hypothetical protein
MPPIINPNSQYSGPEAVLDRNFDYTYPRGLNLKPGSGLHKKILTEVMTRARTSSTIMKARFPQWNEIDHTLTTYIPLDEKERIVKHKDFRKPVSIVFPYTYTILETLLSLYINTFLQDPIFNYVGVGSDDVIGAILLEKLVSLQCYHNKVGLALHTQARDAFTYGLGVVTPIWKTEYGKKTVITKVKRPGIFGSFMTQTLKRVQDNQLLFEGNALENVDPYLYLPDTTVPIHDPQKGEFVGWVSSSGYNKLLGVERNDKEVFNVQYLQALKGKRTSLYFSDQSGRWTKAGINTRDNFFGTSNEAIDIVKMFIELIPSEWGLSSKSYPEKWYFEVANDQVVIKAQPTGLEHGMFPVSVIVPDFDGYSLSPISRMETLYGMQGVLDFLFNSHITNVRKAINDILIVDPQSVNMEDLKNPSPGKLVRLRRPRWGQGVKDVVQQLLVNDVTRGNVADSSFIVQWMDRISGADQSMQGSVRQGGPERLTGAEFQGTRAGALSRFDRIAKVVGMQGLQDIGVFFGAHVKQMMKNESYVRLAGDQQELLLQEYGASIRNDRIKISPEDINVLYNVRVKDGANPGGNYSQSWVQLFQILAQNPEISQKFDLVRIFMHIARGMGAKDVNDFVLRGGNIQPNAMSVPQIQQLLQQGNLVPTDQITSGVPQ